MMKRIRTPRKSARHLGLSAIRRKFEVESEDQRRNSLHQHVWLNILGVPLCELGMTGEDEHRALVVYRENPATGVGVRYLKRIRRRCRNPEPLTLVAKIMVLRA
jgi:hypothetical protein